MRPSLVCLLAVVLAGGCGPADDERVSAVRLALPAARSAALPPPTAPLPRRAQALAADLTATRVRLLAAIDAWTDKAAPPPRDVTLLALRHQRLYHALAGDRRLATATLRRLRGRAGAEAHDVVTAQRELAALYADGPPDRRRLKLGAAEPAAALRADYARAFRRFRVGFPLLAAVNYVESAFNRVRSTSTAGARGPMQFMPATWAAYGLGGDIRDSGDAILAAANYLHANGAPGDEARALSHYNPSPRYVRAIRRYARAIRRDERFFYVIYAWQVFRRTKSGLVQLTGPGRCRTACSG